MANILECFNLNECPPAKTFIVIAIIVIVINIIANLYASNTMTKITQKINSMTPENIMAKTIPPQELAKLSEEDKKHIISSISENKMKSTPQNLGIYSIIGTLASLLVCLVIVFLICCKINTTAAWIVVGVSGIVSAINIVGLIMGIYGMSMFEKIIN